MINQFAHESVSQHAHGGDSSSPAIYIGVIVVAAVLLLVGVVFLLSKDKPATNSVKNDTKED